jgi:hypothetical protein
MGDGHIVGRRSVLLGLAAGLLGASGCGTGGPSGGNVDPKKGDDMKQKKLDSMKEIMQKKQGGKRPK